MTTGTISQYVPSLAAMTAMMTSPARLMVCQSPTYRYCHACTTNTWIRHTGNQFAADDGASLGELMERMVHASPRAARIYLRVSKARSRHIADKLNARLREARPQVGEDSLGHVEGTPTLNQTTENGGAGRGSGSGVQECCGGDEGT